MAGYRNSNSKVIQRAFTRFKESAEGIISKGIIALAQAGLAYLVEAHDNHRDGMSHTEEDNTIGYAVSYNGTVIESGSFKGGEADLPGDAEEEAKRLLAGSQGWVAIILSDMEGWYRADWEMDFLQYSADQVRANFHKFFKKVK